MEANDVGGALRPDIVRAPGYAALRRFRESKPHSEYFLTINLSKRGHGLESQALTALVIDQWRRLEAEDRWSVRTAVVMPDHLHLLVCLGSCYLLDECVRLFKGRLSPALRAHRLGWQHGFYERQMRANDDEFPVFLYIYLNPYRAKLLPASEIWPGYYCRADDWAWFGAMTRESAPQPEWLR